MDCHVSNFNTVGFLVWVSHAGDQPQKSPGCFFLSGRNALVCSHDHLTLFLTLVSGLEFIRFDLDLVRCLGSWYWREAREGTQNSIFQSGACWVWPSLATPVCSDKGCLWVSRIRWRGTDLWPGFLLQCLPAFLSTRGNGTLPEVS